MNLSLQSSAYVFLTLTIETQKWSRESVNALISLSVISVVLKPNPLMDLA